MDVSDDHGVGRSNQATRPRVLLSLYTHFDSHRFFSLFFSLVPHWLWIQTFFTSRSSSWRHHTLSSIQDRTGPLVLLYTRGATTTLWRVVMNSFRFFVSLFRFQSSVSSYPFFSFLAFSASPFRLLPDLHFLILPWMSATPISTVQTAKLHTSVTCRSAFWPTSNWSNCSNNNVNTTKTKEKKNPWRQIVTSKTKKENNSSRWFSLSV